MFVEGTLRWQVTEDCPWDLLMALCLRDMAGLRDLGDPVLPAVVPAVPVIARAGDGPGERGAPGGAGAVSGDDRSGALRAQWASWWARSALRETRPVVTPLRPPHFTAFDRELELQDLIEEHYERAARWARERRDDYLVREAADHEARAADIVDPVREREHELRRQAGYFRLDICVLPLAERGVWVVAPHTVAISSALRDDTAAFRAWWSGFSRVLI